MDDRDPPPDSETNAGSVFGGDTSSGIVEMFERLRGKLTLYFEMRQCIDPEELADETLERVVQKLCEGTEISNLFGYSYGVAKNIFYEHLRRERAKQKYVDAQKHRFGTDPPDDKDEADLREHQLRCLEGCVARLDEQQRWMLSEYYRFSGQRKFEHRKEMAEKLHISREALTLRVFHLKQRLKKCVKDCVENT